MYTIVYNNLIKEKLIPSELLKHDLYFRERLMIDLAQDMLPHKIDLNLRDIKLRIIKHTIEENTYEFEYFCENAFLHQDYNPLGYFELKFNKVIKEKINTDNIF